MSSNKPTPTPEARQVSATTAEEVPFRGGPYEVGVELEQVGSTAATAEGGSTIRPRANRDTNRPLRSMCFLVEDCKYCRPEAKSQDDRGTLPEQVESPAVNALRDCLETLERDRLEVEARRAKCPTLMKRYYLALRGKAV